VRAYVGPGEEILYPRHGFLMYAINAKGVGAGAITAPEVDLTADCDNLLKAVTPKTRAVFLANPNNPTGSYMRAAEVRRLRENLPSNVLLVIDAAYAEYVNRNDYSPGIELVEDTPNTVMTRTFSKIHGMGGLRLGWAYCPAPVADVLNRLRNPFNAPSAAQAAGIAAIEDVAFTDLARAHNDHWLPWTAEKIAALGFEVAPSVANFVLVHFKDEAQAKAADDFMRARGIIVRRVAAYGLPRSLRITIGTGEEMQAVIEAMTEFAGS
jgi:histidinol-phosphate aminotransferase